jgi:hypothetical protein
MEARALFARVRRKGERANLNAIEMQLHNAKTANLCKLRKLIGEVAYEPSSIGLTSTFDLWYGNEKLPFFPVMHREFCKHRSALIWPNEITRTRTCCHGGAGICLNSEFNKKQKLICA